MKKFLEDLGDAVRGQFTRTSQDFREYLEADGYEVADYDDSVIIVVDDEDNEYEVSLLSANNTVFSNTVMDCTTNDVIRFY